MTLFIDSIISLSLIANVILFLFLLSWRESAKELLEEKSELKHALDTATLRARLAYNIIDERNKYIEKLESERQLAPPSKPSQPQTASQVIAGIQDEILRQQIEANKLESFREDANYRFVASELYTGLYDLTKALDQNSLLKDAVRANMLAPGNSSWDRIGSAMLKYKKLTGIIQ